MKPILIIASLLFGQIAFGQHSKDTTISKRVLDCLRVELWQKAETINRMAWVYQLKVNTNKVDTIFIRPDSIVINFTTKENKQLYQESINLRKDFCKGLIVRRFFNNDEKPTYIEYWDGLCYDETEKEEDVLYFDAKLRQVERIIYNKFGQKIRRVIYEYQSYRPGVAYQITYWFDNGKESQTAKKIDKYSFWD